MEKRLGQVILSGLASSVDLVEKEFKSIGARSLIDLPVSAPFHCSLMKPASEKMKPKIEATDFLTPKPGVISNVTAEVVNHEKNIKKLLIQQITSRVRWRESVDFMTEKGVVEFIEIGPGKVLSGLVKKINREVKISNINVLDDLKNDKF